MAEHPSSYSPHIQIYLEVDDQKIRLSDVLFQSATLYEKASVPPKTHASLVFSIDGVEEKEGVSLENGISIEDSSVVFRYTDPSRLNGRSELNSL